MSGNEIKFEVPVKIEKTYVIPEDIIDTIIEMGGYGIGYWAVEAYADHAAQTYTVVEEDGNKFELTFQQLANALVLIGTRNSPNYVDQYAQRTLREIEDGEKYPGGDIDSDLADVIVQIAYFGEVIYG